MAQETERPLAEQARRLRRAADRLLQERAFASSGALEAVRLGAVLSARAELLRRAAQDVLNLGAERIYAELQQGRLDERKAHAYLRLARRVWKLRLAVFGLGAEEVGSER